MRRLGRVTAMGSVLALLMGAGFTTSCGKKKKDSSTSSDTSITVAGQLSLTGESTSFNLANPALTELDVYCVSFEVPPVAGTGEVGEDGAFELTLATTDASIGCFILKETEVLGSIVFEDPSETDLAGGSKTNDRLAVSGGRSDFGAITLDLASGKAVVNISKIVTSGSGLKDTKSITGDDFTGQYKATSAGIENMPTGYEGLCSGDQQSQGGDECRGPSDGDQLLAEAG